MRHTPAHSVTDPAVVRTLIDENPWATIVSTAPDGALVASHCPVLLDDGDDLAVVTHLGRPDDEIHGIGEREVLVIFAGPHGYVSPSWYSPLGVRAPTWNFAVVHAHGTPVLLGEQDNLMVLERLVARFEQYVDQPLYLERETAERLAPGTAGIRIPIDRWQCKVKMSQDKDPESRRNVIDALRRPGPYQHPRLADEMERALSPEG
jgi:transcriptional regulator